MNKNSVVLLLSASFLTASANADTMSPLTVQPDWTWVGTLSAGPLWGSGDTTQTFYLTPDIEKTYAAEQTQGSGLVLNHLYTNGVLFNLTYLA